MRLRIRNQFCQLEKQMKSPSARSQAKPRDTDADRRAPWPTYLNGLLGAWLFTSTFLWQHTANAMSNTWIVGFLMAFTAVVAVNTPAARWFNTVLAVWLALSTLAMSDIRPVTSWNNMIVAVVAFALSVLPSPNERRV
jgi:hypothetical protein